MMTDEAPAMGNVTPAGRLAQQRMDAAIERQRAALLVSAAQILDEPDVVVQM